MPTNNRRKRTSSDERQGANKTAEKQTANPNTPVKRMKQFNVCISCRHQTKKPQDDCSKHSTADSWALSGCTAIIYKSELLTGNYEGNENPGARGLQQCSTGPVILQKTFI